MFEVYVLGWIITMFLGRVIVLGDHLVKRISVRYQMWKAAHIGMAFLCLLWPYVLWRICNDQDNFKDDVIQFCQSYGEDSEG